MDGSGACPSAPDCSRPWAARTRPPRRSPRSSRCFPRASLTSPGSSSSGPASMCSSSRATSSGAVEMATQALDADYPSVGLRLGIAASGLRAAADLAESSRARREGSTATEAMAAGEVLGAEVARQRAILSGWSDPTPSKVAAAYLADAELARLAGASDPDLWAAIEVAYEPVPMPFPVAYARFRRAEALLVKDRTKTMPTDLLRAAYATCASLNAAPMIASIESLARRARIDLTAPSIAPVEPGPSPAGGSQASPGRPRPERARARGPRARRGRPDERRDRSRAVHQHQDGLEPRDPHPGQARGDESRGGGRDRGAGRADPRRRWRDERLRASSRGPGDHATEPRASIDPMNARTSALKRSGASTAVR